MTRPRTLRLLYSSLAFTALLGLYWLAGLHSEEAVTGHRQPDTQDYHGRGEDIFVLYIRYLLSIKFLTLMYTSRSQNKTFFLGEICGSAS